MEFRIQACLTLEHSGDLEVAHGEAPESEIVSRFAQVFEEDFLKNGS